MSANHSWGQPIRLEELTIPQAIAIAQAVQKHPLTSLVQAVQNPILGMFEGVEFELRPELPQYPVADIRQGERLVIAVHANPRVLPLVLALRNDFPRLPHQNMTAKGQPRQICLFEQKYRDIQSSLTPLMLLDRIHGWLSRAATGQLHLEGQALEPLLLETTRIILDDPAFSNTPNSAVHYASMVHEKPLIIKISTEPPVEKEQLEKGRYHVIALNPDPCHIPVIHHTPTTLEDLITVLRETSIDLVELLRESIKKLFHENASPQIRKTRALIILRIPRKRDQNTLAETHEDWCFLCSETNEVLSEHIGIYQRLGTDFLPLVAPQPVSNLDKIKILSARPTHKLNPTLAKRLSGTTQNDMGNILAVGAGTIGSQVVMNLARQGFGPWTIIDEDVLLPHNIARHALNTQYEGYGKAQTLAHEINTLFENIAFAKPIQSDILWPTDGVVEAIRVNDLILDCTASRAVRHSLAAADGNAQRMAVFLAGNGHYLVTLAEGIDRSIRLDDLETQLLTAPTRIYALKNMFEIVPLESIRFSGGCGDLTTVLPEDRVATFAGVASLFIKGHHNSNEPSINIWQLHPDTLTMSHYTLLPSTVQIIEKHGWQLRITHSVIKAMRRNRKKRLPNETGGVLMGSTDVFNKIIYICQLLPSPPDSTERPTTYIRGTLGLLQSVNQIAQKSGGALAYVGEWHSHPEGHTAQPSNRDLESHEALKSLMGEEGLPALILIQADANDPEALITEV